MLPLPRGHETLLVHVFLVHCNLCHNSLILLLSPTAAGRLGAVAVRHSHLGTAGEVQEENVDIGLWRVFSR